jgi:phospholipase A1/A2
LSVRIRQRFSRGPFGPSALALAAIAASLASGAMAQGAADCVQETQDAARLACYDRLFRRGVAPAAPAAAAASSAVPPAAAPTGGAAAVASAPAGVSGSSLATNLFTTTWELTPSTKRGTFVVRTYQPNFVLPLHYSSSINQAPSSPTRGLVTDRPPYRATEAKFQISLRTKVAEGLLLPDADLWVAYTQRSLWQVWNPQQSSPFRSTDYQPEAIYVVPVPARFGTLPGGWRWRMTQLGLVHQCNGQGGASSRSWNRVYATAAFDRGDFGLMVRGYRRLGEKTNDDNPDMSRFIGNTELVASWLPGLSTASLTWRTHTRSAGRGSLQLDWTYPVNPAQPTGLRWYAQLFTGYGETLLDYNHRQTSLGLGLTLFQF